MNIGQQLKKLRKSWDLSQKEFARRIPGQTDYTYIGKVERGRQYPSIKFLERICKTYSVPMSYFFEDGSEATKGMVRYSDILNWLSKEEKQAENSGQRELEKTNYLAYGFFKTLAEHIRSMKKFLRESIEK